MTKTLLIQGLIVTSMLGALPVSASPQCPAPKPFQPVPKDFQLTPTIHQAFTSLSDSKPKALVNFWASWCPPCRKELPMLARLHKAFGAGSDSKVAIHAINVGDSAANKEAVLDQTGATSLGYTTIDNFDALRAMGARGLPYTLLFRNQQPAYIASGYLSTPEQTLYEWLLCLQQNATE